MTNGREAQTETQDSFPQEAVLLQLSDELGGSIQYWWLVYRGTEKPCLQIMLLREGERPKEAVLRSFSNYHRRFRINLTWDSDALKATPQNTLENSVNGWTRWLAALVLRWTSEVLPEVRTLRLHGLQKNERLRLFPPDGSLSRMRELTTRIQTFSPGEPRL